MIILLISLISLISIYATRLLSKHKMRIAGIAVTVLYLYLISWVYLVFIFDIADLGFTGDETMVSLLHGSSIYHSFVHITAKMAFIPLPFLQVIVGITGLVLVSSIAVIFHGVFTLSKEIIQLVKSTGWKKIKAIKETKPSVNTSIRKESIIRLYCRANC